MSIDTNSNPFGAEGRPPRVPGAGEPGKSENDFKPMTKPVGLISAFETVLKYPRQVIFQLHAGGQLKLTLCLLLIGLASMACYGMVVGTFSGGTQLWAAPVKMTAGLVLSALICLPSLYVFTYVNGVEVRPSAVIGYLCAGIALSAILLVGFAPVAWLFSESTYSVTFMGALHLMFWMIGIWFGLPLLFGGLEYAKSATLDHLRVWGFIFVLVCLQMTTTLRPIVGTADTLLPTEKKFFLVHWWQHMK
jgi:hypothetical protein